MPFWSLNFWGDINWGNLWLQHIEINHSLCCLNMNITTSNEEKYFNTFKRRKTNEHPPIPPIPQKEFWNNIFREHLHSKLSLSSGKESLASVTPNTLRNFEIKFQLWSIFLSFIPNEDNLIVMQYCINMKNVQISSKNSVVIISLQCFCSSAASKSALRKTEFFRTLRGLFGVSHLKFCFNLLQIMSSVWCLQSKLFGVFTLLNNS